MRPKDPIRDISWRKENLMTIVVGLFRAISDANKAVESLKHYGLDEPEVSVLARQEVLETLNVSDTEKKNEVAIGAVAGAASGATFGTFAGLFLGLTAIALPGVGPVLSVGALATVLGSTIIGAGVGAAAGGLLLGALVKMGVPEEDARLYTEGVKRGGVLVTVQTDKDHASQVAQMLDEANAVDIDTLEEVLQEENWSYFDQMNQSATERAQA
jgi:hypothetical protein